MASTTTDVQPSMEKTIDIMSNAKGDIHTFFSDMPHKFTDIVLEENEHIPLQPFLEACHSLLPVFDHLGPTLFSPVVKDIQGNINKLNAKHQSKPDSFTTLQNILLHEIEYKNEPKEIDATESLLWLKRAFEFISIFFKEVISGCESLSDCAYTAYSQTLKAYHGWIVRGVFSVIVRAVPHRTTFVKALSLNANGNEANIEKQIEIDGAKEIESLDKILLVINNFYAEHNLDTSKVV